MAGQGRRQREGSGDVIAEIETDKATMEVEAVDEGVVEALLVPTRAPRRGEGQRADRAPDAEPSGAAPARSGGRPARQPPSRPSRPSRRQSREEAGGRRPRLRVDAGRARIQGQDHQAPPCATPCATPWPRRCAATRDVFLMGEEVAQYQGAYKVSRDLLAGIRRAAGDRHPDHRARLRRPGRRRGDGGA